MHVLFVHQNFPAQFRYLAPRLVRDHGWQCTFVTARPEGTLPGVEKVLYSSKGGATKANHFCTRNFENAVWEAHGVYETLKQRTDIRPDLVVARPRAARTKENSGTRRPRTRATRGREARV